MILLNNNCLVQLKTDSKIMGNGLAIKETRGKRDIVSGTLVAMDDALLIPKNSVVWFPLYAATAIVMEGVEYLVVNFSDIIIIE